MKDISYAHQVCKNCNIVKYYYSLLHHYSSLQCHMILQKSFQYADLLLKVHFLLLSMLKTVVVAFSVFLTVARVFWWLPGWCYAVALMFWMFFAVLLECFGVRFPKATIVASSVITNRVQWNLRVATIVS